MHIGAFAAMYTDLHGGSDMSGPEGARGGTISYESQSIMSAQGPATRWPSREFPLVDLQAEGALQEWLLSEQTPEHGQVKRGTRKLTRPQPP